MTSSLAGHTLGQLTECVDSDGDGQGVTQLVTGVTGVVTTILHTDRVKQQFRLLTENLIIEVENYIL